MRNLIIHGMRRNGTTVLFDAFVRDPRFHTLYEPFSAVRHEPLPGGGSGVHDVDLFAEVAGVRRGFLAAHPNLPEDVVNHGGPLRPEVEVDPDLPGPVEDYLRRLVESPRPWVLKEVRLAAKIAHLARLAPDSVLLWPTRDPRAVVRSYLYGRGERYRDRFPDADAVFETRTEGDPWSSRRLAEAVVRRDGRSPEPPLTDAERVLVVWGDAVRAALEEGPAHFGGHSSIVRHEDFCADPDGTLHGILTALGGDTDPEVLSWVRSVVRPPSPWAYADDPRWRAAYDRTGITDLVARLGYPV